VTLSGNSLKQTVLCCASVHQAAKLVAALLRAARVTAGLAASNGRLPQADCQEPGSAPELSVIEYRLYLYQYSLTIKRERNTL